MESYLYPEDNLVGEASVEITEEQFINLFADTSKPMHEKLKQMFENKYLS